MSKEALRGGILALVGICAYWMRTDLKVLGKFQNSGFDG